MSSSPHATAAPRQFIARPAVELHPLAVFAGNAPKAVVLGSHSSPGGGRRADVGKLMWGDTVAMKPAGRVR
jgi:hypothetical protein